jgi:hypothetical protein
MASQLAQNYDGVPWEVHDSFFFAIAMTGSWAYHRQLYQSPEPGWLSLSVVFRKFATLLPSFSELIDVKSKPILDFNFI